VQCVGEERNRSTEHDNHRLKESRGSQHEKRDFGGADSFGARVQDGLMIGDMIVAQQMPEPMLESVPTWFVVLGRRPVVAGTGWSHRSG
jgi:hypothetical protein